MGETKPQLVIFDCDGVLIDSEIISANTLIEMLAALGTEISASYIQDHFLGRSFPTVAALLRQEFNLDLPDDFEATYRRRLLKDFTTNLFPTDGVEQVLKSINLPVCVATSSSPERVKRSLEITGLAQYFRQSVYTASQVERGKPAPDLFLFAAENEGINPQNCLVLEDSLPGLEAAAAADMKALRYLGGTHFDHIERNRLKNTQSVPSFDSWFIFLEMRPELFS